jgi:hypothetical protein
MSEGRQRWIVVVDDTRRPINDSTEQSLVAGGWKTTRLSSPETQAWVDESSELSVAPTVMFDELVNRISALVTSTVATPTIGTPSKSVPGQQTRSFCDGGAESLRTIGDAQLSVIEHVPAVRRSDTAIILLNSGVERAVGPGRAWTLAARRWAEQGSVVLRVDHSATGDSGLWPEQHRNDVYGAHAVDDIEQVVEHAQSIGCTNTVLIGMCSSAYSVLELGPNPAVKRIVSINPQLYRIGTPPGPVEEVTNHAKHRLAQIDTKLGLRQKANVVKSMAGRRHRSYEWLNSFAGTDTEVLLLFGDGDRGLRFLEREDAREFQRLQTQGVIDVQRFAGLDHALHCVAGRNAVMSVLDTAIARNQVRVS